MFGMTAQEMGINSNEDRHGKLVAADDRQRAAPGDMEFEQKLRSTPGSLKFRQAPLGEVLGYLQKYTQVNMYVDPQGLQAGREITT